jgi:hypothetical protein
MTTAFLTGLIVIGMLLLRPSNPMWGWIFILAGWAALLLLTIPYRKAIALTIDYAIEYGTDQSS